MSISFLILTWNRDRFLEKSISQLIASISDIENVEIIIMNNGSTDRTKEILEQYRDRDAVRIINLPRNYGLNGYKKLLKEATGEYMVVVDDDVLEFPQNIDQIFAAYLSTYADYGFMAMDVIQNEFTNGAKPGPEVYKDDVRGDKVVQEGLTGAWCTGFRRSDYNKIRFFFQYGPKLSFKMAHDGLLQLLFRKFLKRRSGIIKGQYCLHACGPYYSREYGFLEQDIEKYRKSGMQNFVEYYEGYRTKK